MKDLTELIKTLSELPGPSGMETAVAAKVQEIWAPLTDEIRRDYMGNLIAVKRGQRPAGDESARPRLLLAAHMDEIGLMVTQIEAFPDEKTGAGFLRVTSVGGVDTRHVYGQRVIVHGKRDLPGVIGGPPGYQVESDRHNKPYGFDELFVDVGLSAAEVRDLVSVGDFITFRQEVRELTKGIISGKAFDNRVSVAAVTVCLEYLQDRPHHWDVVAVATVQEEVGLKGATTVSYGERPDAAVVLDVHFAKGPGAKDSELYELGDGPGLSIGPNVHRGIRAGLVKAAGTLEMKTQVDVHSRHSGTDAGAVQIARNGVPTAIIGLPLRSMHTMVETIAVKDIERAGRLLGEFITQLDDQFLPNLIDDLIDEPDSGED